MSRTRENIPGMFECGCRRFLPFVLSVAVLLPAYVPPTHAQGSALPEEAMKKPGGFITALARDDKGRVWVGTETKGVWMIAGESCERVAEDVLGKSSCTALEVSGDGAVWVGTDRQGLYVGWQNKWEPIGTLQGLAGAHVYALASDTKAENSVWCATEGGLCRVVRNKEGGVAVRRFSEVGLREGFALTEFGALATDSQTGVLVAGALIGGIGIWDGQEWKVLESEEQETGVQVNSLLLDAGRRIWAATKRGLLRLGRESGTWKVVAKNDAHAIGLRDPYFTAVCEDKKGRLWVGTRRHGLCRYDPQSDVWVRIEKPGADSFISALCVGADGGLWVGTYGKGLSCIDPEALR